jgi:outer membrane immunogenic protein
LPLCGLAAPVLAADVAVLAPYPTPLRPLYSWTGRFIGFNIGGGAASQDFTDAVGTFVAAPGASLGNHTGHGAVGGGQLGFDYQIGPFVLGVQGVYDLTGMKGSNAQPNPFLYNNSFVQTLGTLTGRVGYTFTPTLLVYGRAGVARVHDLYNVQDNTIIPPIAGSPAPRPAVPPGTILALGSNSSTGWTIATGFEWAFFGGDWTAFVEYDYMSFGSSRVMLLPALVTSAPIPIDVTQRANVVLFGINYRFWSAGPRF